MKRLVSLIVIIITLFVTGCGTVFQYTYNIQAPDPVSMVTDKETLYEDMSDKTLYLTIKGDGWKELNRRDLEYYEEKGIAAPEIDVLVQFGNNLGPTSDQYGFNDVSANAKIKLCGTNASRKQQKNYKIEINKNAGKVSGMKSFILDKSFTDPFRFSNKLCFDFLTKIDSLMSTRTYFTDVYIKDEADGEDSPYVYYGLYTMVEPINKRYLSNRDLDTAGELYEVKDFDFKRHKDIIMQPTDAGYDKKKFETMLEAKGNNDYSKLIKMLDDFETMAIEDFTKKYFEEDNLYDWMAFNILVNNTKTATTNFYLYSPSGTDKFFIIPWDFDNAFRKEYEKEKNEEYVDVEGVDLFKNSEFFRKIVEDKRCRNRLSEHITTLHESVLSKDNTEHKISRTRTNVEYRVYSLPDQTFARTTREKYLEFANALVQQIEDNYYSYYDSFEKGNQDVQE